MREVFGTHLLDSMNWCVPETPRTLRYFDTTMAFVRRTKKAGRTGPTSLRHYVTRAAPASMAADRPRTPADPMPIQQSEHALKRVLRRNAARKLRAGSNVANRSRRLFPNVSRSGSSSAPQATVRIEIDTSRSTRCRTTEAHTTPARADHTDPRNTTAPQTQTRSHRPP